MCVYMCVMVYLGMTARGQRTYLRSPVAGDVQVKRQHVARLWTSYRGRGKRVAKRASRQQHNDVHSG